MTIQIIQTTQAPDAKPVAVSRNLTTSWLSIVETPSYQVPEESFGGGTIIVPGVSEIISPLIVCNKGVATASFSVRAYRYELDTEFIIANSIPVAPNDVLTVPLNGQFFLTGDRLEVQASANNVLDITISYTVGQAEQDDVV